jgi:hypothetical protein
MCSNQDNDSKFNSEHEWRRDLYLMTTRLFILIMNKIPYSYELKVLQEKGL